MSSEHCMLAAKNLYLRSLSRGSVVCYLQWNRSLETKILMMNLNQALLKQRMRMREWVNILILEIDFNKLITAFCWYLIHVPLNLYMVWFNFILNCKQSLIFLLSHRRSRAGMGGERLRHEERGWKPEQRQHKRLWWDLWSGNLLLFMPP